MLPQQEGQQKSGIIFSQLQKQPWLLPIYANSPCLQREQTLKATRFFCDAFAYGCSTISASKLHLMSNSPLIQYPLT